MGIAALEIAAFLKFDGVGTCVWSNLDAPPPEARSSFQYSQVFFYTAKFSFLLSCKLLFFSSWVVGRETSQSCLDWVSVPVTNWVLVTVTIVDFFSHIF